MFMFPEPPPIDYIIEDVSPSFLSDGIFLYGQPGESHKCIAKRLRPISRKLSDPVASPSELDPRYIDASAEKERSRYAEPRDAFLIYELLCRINEQKCTGEVKKAIFPRSRQFEYEYIQDRRVKSIPKEKFLDTFQCRAEKEKSEKWKQDGETCYVLKAPFWWKDKVKKDSKLPIGCINDYAFKRSEYVEDDRRRIERSMTTDRAFDRNDDEIQAREIAPEAKDAVNNIEYQKKTSNKIYTRVPCPIEDDLIRGRDTRWQPIYEIAGFSGTDKERGAEMRKLTRPYMHELQTWYSKNLPTKLLLPVRWKGKKPILEYRFSHL